VDIVQHIADNFGWTWSDALAWMGKSDDEALRIFHVGNHISRDILH
jgi:hypothetical protein